MKVALVYDRVNKFGGAERVLLALHEIFPEAPLYTAVYDKNKAPWANVFPKVIPSFLQKIPLLRNHHELLGALTPIAYELFNFDEFDLVISVTSEAAKGIITKPGTKHVCYCLTPTRYIWSHYREYLNNTPSKLSWIPFYKLISKPFLHYVRKWDEIASERPDTMIAISTAVKERILKYYKRKSAVIYPPVDVERFNEIDAKSKTGFPKDYYLIVSRLIPYKKVDLAIAVFNELGLPLVIVGTGSEERKLKSIAGKNIIFKGFLEDGEVDKIFKGAKGFIYPQEEDFGITAVEAQAAGVPVIAYKAGGTLDTVIKDKTGVFFDDQNKESLKAAITRFGTLFFRKSDLINNAKRFSKKRFKNEFSKMIEKEMAKY